MVVVVGKYLIRQGEFRVMKLIARVEEEDVTMMRVAMIVHLAAMITTPEKIVINLRGVPGTRRDKRLSCSSSSMHGCSYYSSHNNRSRLSTRMISCSSNRSIRSRSVSRSRSRSASRSHVNKISV